MRIAAPWPRALVAGLAGGVAWLGGLALCFGPAQLILADPDLQSAKFLSVFGDPPLPRMAEAPWILPLGLLAIGGAWGLVYRLVSASWPPAWWKRGARFALVGWVMMALWFEFYLPWNAMHEPVALVALELACWAGVMLCVGMAIAGVDTLLSPKQDE